MIPEESERRSISSPSRFIPALMAASTLFFATTSAAPKSATVCSSSDSRRCRTPNCLECTLNALSNCSSALRSLSEANSICDVACSRRVSNRETSVVNDVILSFIVVFSSCSRAAEPTDIRSLSSASTSSASRSPPSFARCCSALITRLSISCTTLSFDSFNCCITRSCAAARAAISALCDASVDSFSCLCRDRSRSIRDAARSSSWRCASISRSADSRSEFSWRTCRRSLRSSLREAVLLLLLFGGALRLEEDGACCFGFTVATLLDVPSPTGVALTEVGAASFVCTFEVSLFSAAGTTSASPNRSFFCSLPSPFALESPSKLISSETASSNPPSILSMATPSTPESCLLSSMLSFGPVPTISGSDGNLLSTSVGPPSIFKESAFCPIFPLS
mmetsp:Transcript_21399/g.46467  ORF Transcript_21399/g.46467 Transcript_21399/m.46467 type:complete len:393 (+) Transcript_21399:1079-2257(+)